MIRAFWVSCNKFTCYIETDDKLIITNKSAPIVKRFIGQPMINLVNWMKKLGGFKYHEYR